MSIELPTVRDLVRLAYQPIVRQLTGRTVVDYVNQMLLMEASFLLRTSSLSVTQVADRLSFADTASFCKFFTRLRGQSPKSYRSTQGI